MTSLMPIILLSLMAYWFVSGKPVSTKPKEATPVTCELLYERCKSCFIGIEKPSRNHWFLEKRDFCCSWYHSRKCLAYISNYTCNENEIIFDKPVVREKPYKHCEGLLFDSALVNLTCLPGTVLFTIIIDNLELQLNY